MWVFLVYLKALQVQLGLWIYTQTNPKSCNGKLPPGSVGFPLIGETIFCWSQIFHRLTIIWEDSILPSQIRFFDRVFWVRKKFLVANRLFFFEMICQQHNDIDQKYIKNEEIWLRWLLYVTSLSIFVCMLKLLVRLEFATEDCEAISN